jgi:hypothetical protein
MSIQIESVDEVREIPISSGRGPAPVDSVE